MILGLGKRDTRFKMSEGRLFKDLKKMFKSSIRKMLFLWITLDKIFIIFSLGVIFSKFLDGIKEKAAKHQTR